MTLLKQMALKFLKNLRDKSPPQGKSPLPNKNPLLSKNHLQRIKVGQVQMRMKNPQKKEREVKVVKSHPVKVKQCLKSSKIKRMRVVQSMIPNQIQAKLTSSRIVKITKSIKRNSNKQRHRNPFLKLLLNRHQKDLPIQKLTFNYLLQVRPK